MKPDFGRLLFSSFLILALSATQMGCGNKPAVGPKSGKISVVATTGQIADLARRIGGDAVELEEMMGPGVDPHEYQPTADDTKLLTQADLVLYNGMHLEGKMVNILENNPRAKAVTRSVPPEQLLTEEGQPDPHLWFDISLWVQVLDQVEKDMIEAVPEKKEEFSKNAEAYRKELKELHESVKKEIGAIPEEKRVFVTAHDAFNYLGRAYGLQVYGLQGISTETQAGEGKMQEVVKLIIEKQIKALFDETSVPNDGIKAVIERCKSQNYEVRKAEGSLFSDAMGEAGTPEGTYPGMVRHNVRVIVDALK